MSRTVRVSCPTVAATRALGRRLGGAATPGTVLALSGDLGAGKTVLAKGVGEGLGVPTRITSPTFVLVALHEDGRLPLWHADLYRIEDGADLDDLGLDEATEGVLVVEWAARAPEALPEDRVEIAMHLAAGEEPAGGASGARGGALRPVQLPDVPRVILLTANGPRHAAWLAALVAEGLGGRTEASP